MISKSKKKPEYLYQTEIFVDIDIQFDNAVITDDILADNDDVVLNTVDDKLEQVLKERFNTEFCYLLEVDDIRLEYDNISYIGFNSIYDASFSCIISLPVYSKREKNLLKLKYLNYLERFACVRNKNT